MFTNGWINKQNVVYGHGIQDILPGKYGIQAY